MKKRGQITPFIILGLVFLMFFLIILFTKSYRIEKIGAISSDELNPIKYYVDLCAKSSASDALYILGVQGGYTAPPKLYFQSAYAKIAYWYYEGQDTSPTIEEMEQELSAYVDKALPECIESLAAFSDMGFEFEFGEINTETKINQNNVEFNIDYPITIIKGESKAEIREFYKMIPVRLGHIHSISKEIVGNEIEDPDWIDITYLVDQDLDFKIYPYDENTLIYSVLDNQSIIKYNTPFMFLFANLFEEKESLKENE